MAESDAGVPQAAVGYESAFERISGRQRIHDILTRLAVNKSPLAVVVNGTEGRYVSSLLEVRHDVMLLDELNPADGHALLLAAGSLRVVARLNGASLHFASKVIDSGEQGGISFYRIAVPDTVNYRQRRRSFRVPIDPNLHVPVMLADGECRVNCNLHDISPDGVSILLDASVCQRIEKLKLFPSCTIMLPEHHPIHCSFEVRNLRSGKGDEPCVVGGRFVVTNSRDRTSLARVVTSFERKSIRKRKQ